MFNILYFYSYYFTGRTQFKATEFWNEAVSNIKTNVELKRKRIKLRSYAECFTGCEVVDVAFHFLNQSKENLINKEITRDQAVKVISNSF